MYAKAVNFANTSEIIRVYIGLEVGKKIIIKNNNLKRRKLRIYYVF